MKVAVIGGNGQLGSDVLSAFLKNDDNAIALSHEDVDITSIESLQKALNGIAPAVIVNTAAMHHVENCEKNPLLAYQVNALAARNLAIVAKELDVKLVHVSTDYVFDGCKGSP